MHDVLIIFGSKSDIDKMQGAAKILKEFDIPYKAHILSAHRVPEKLLEVVRDFEDDGGKVIIAGAGLAAHLPGVIASQTVLPVVGVPINGAVGGMDALFSIVQMPKSIPVATVGIDNSFNAGMLTVEMLGINDGKIRQQLKEYRKKMKREFIRENDMIEL